MLTRGMSFVAVLLVGLTGGGLGLVAGCGTTLTGGGAKIEASMSGTPAVAAAEGKVTAKAQSNGNQEVEVEVQHLAAPERAFPGMSAYVVWLVPPNGGTPQNMGGLSLGENLKGKLKLQTPYKTFDILITAEATPMATSPSGNRALSVSVQLPA